MIPHIKDFIDGDFEIGTKFNQQTLLIYIIGEENKTITLEDFLDIIREGSKVKKGDFKI